MKLIKQILKAIIISLLNLYFHSDKKSLNFLHKILRKRYFDDYFISEQEIETIIATQVQNSYDLAAAKQADTLVVFFEIAPYRMCGGQMSLFSYCKYSKEILGDKAAVIMTTIPGKYTYSHNDCFENDIEICRWEQVKNLLKGKKKCILHIPEVDIINPETGEELVRKSLLDENFDLLRSIDDLHINIVNQQIKLMPSPAQYSWLYLLTPHVTMTVCNKAAATQDICNTFGMPLHMLSVYYDLGNVQRIPVPQKEKLILLSPDLPPKGIQFKLNLIKKLHKELPDYKIMIIQKLKLQDCMRLTAASAAVITFGEGFDGYLNNSPQVGTLAFAVYNDVFFPDKTWQDFPNIYRSYDELGKKIIDDIKRFMDDEKLYEKTVTEHETAVLNMYKFSEYLDNLKRFYANKLVFYPEKNQENKNDAR